MKMNTTQIVTNPLTYLIAVIVLLPLQAWACVNLLLDQQRAWADMLSTYIRTNKFSPNFQAGDPRLLAATMFADCILLVVAIFLINKRSKAQCLGAQCPSKQVTAA
jgi:hypothetical protein